MKKAIVLLAVLLCALSQTKSEAALLDFSLRTSQTQSEDGLYSVNFYVDSVENVSWRKGKVALEFNQNYFSLVDYSMGDNLDVDWKWFANPILCSTNGLLCFKVKAERGLDTSGEVLIGTFVFESNGEEGWENSEFSLMNSTSVYKTKFKGFHLKDDIVNGSNHCKKLDSIQVSTAHLPEPSVLAILGLGGMIMTSFRKK